MYRGLLLPGILALSSVGCIVTTGAAGGTYSHAYAGNIPLTLTNDTPVTACFVHMSPSTDHNWGDDWLGPTETIPPGGSRTFMVGGGPGWDVQVLTCQHAPLAQAQNIPMFNAAQIPISSLGRGGYAQPQPVYVQPQQAQPVYAAPPPVYVR